MTILYSALVVALLPLWFCDVSGSDIQRLEYEVSSEDFLYSFVSKNLSFVVNNVTTRWPDYHELRSGDFLTSAKLSNVTSSAFSQNSAIRDEKGANFIYDVTNDKQFQKLIRLPAVLISCKMLREEFKKLGKVYLAGAKSKTEKNLYSPSHSLLAVLKGKMKMTVNNATAYLIAGNMVFLPANQKAIMSITETVFFVNFTLPSDKKYHAAHCSDRPSLYVMTRDVDFDKSNAMFTDHTLPDIALNTGSTIPPIGLGAGRLFERTNEIVKTALNIGYKLIDTAQTYSGEEARENFTVSSEQEIGRALSESKVERKKVFLVTKIDPDFMTYEGTIAKTMTSLKNLQVDYLDAVLIHDFTASEYCSVEDTNCKLSPWIGWRALEELQSRELVRSIGVSNINPEDLKFLIETYAKSKVSIVQNWFDPFHQDIDVRNICKLNNIVYMGYSTLGAIWSGEDGMGYDVNPVLNHNVIVDVAAMTDLPTSTYVLRWAMENNVIVIPSTRNSFHLELNMAARYLHINPSSLPMIEKMNNELGNPDDITWRKSDYDQVFKKSIRNRGKELKRSLTKDEL